MCARWLRKHMQARHIIALGLQIGSALQHVHARRWAHRDVKALNIVLDWDEDEECYVPKLCDFGVATKIDANGESGESGMDWTP